MSVIIGAYTLGDGDWFAVCLLAGLAALSIGFNLVNRA